MSRYDNPFNDYTTSHKIYELLEDEPSLITLFKNQYVTDDMWMFCIQRDTSLFKEIKHPSEAMCLFALSEDGRNLKYMVSRFKDIKLTPKMIWLAVTNQPSAICYVPKKMLTDELKEYVYTLDPSMMVGEMNIRHTFLVELITKHPQYIKYIEDPNEDLLYIAMDKDPNTVVYIKEFTPRIRKLIDEKYPELSILLPPLHSDVNEPSQESTTN